MISGTSFDAVEALLVELELDGEVLVCDLVEHRSVPTRAGPRARSRHCCRRPPTTIEQVCRFDVEIGQFFATVAKDLVDRHGPADAVCSHGQTVYHWVEGDVAMGTLQLGEPAWIAELTGAAVVSDVRNRDIAARWPRCSACQPARRVVAGLQPVGRVGVPQPGRHRQRHGRRAGPAAYCVRHRAGKRLDGRVGRGLYRRRGELRPSRCLGGTVPPDEHWWTACWTTPIFPSRPLSPPGRSISISTTCGAGCPKGGTSRPEDLLASLTAASAEIVAWPLRPFHAP